MRKLTKFHAEAAGSVPEGARSGTETMDWERVDGNLQSCFAALAGGRERAETRQIGGVRVVSLGVRFQMFNAAFLAHPVKTEADLDRQVATAAVHFGARGLPWALWLCDSYLDAPLSARVEPVMMRRGLRFAAEMPGMIARELTAPARELPSCDLREVKGGIELRDFRAIGARCFSVPGDWFAEVFDGRNQLREPFQAWVGYVGEKAIGTAATLANDRGIGIYNLATIPRYRRRGYGEAMLRECVARAARELPVVLQSTRAGFSLYESMGFRTVTRFRVWIS